MAGTNTLTSNALHILNLDNLFIQAHIVSTPNGSMLIQVSSNHQEDQQGNVTVPGNWITVSTTSIVSGAPSDIGIDLNQLGATWLRVVYTNTSGSGTLNVTASGKGLM